MKILEYHQGGLPFQIPHYLRHSILGWNLDAYMDMVHTRTCFYYLYLFVFTQFSHNFSYRPAISSIYQLASEFRSKNDVIFAVPTGMVKLWSFIVGFLCIWISSRDNLLSHKGPPFFTYLKASPFWNSPHGGEFSALKQKTLCETHRALIT